MLQRWAAFARHARNYFISSSRIPPNPKVSLSNSHFLLLLQSSPSSSSSFPPFSYLSTNPRFFSQTTDPAPSEENGVVQMNSDDVEEEQVHEIDADEFETVLSLLQGNSDGSLESCLDSMHQLTLHQDFLLQIIETPNVSGHNLIRFVKWASNEKSFKLTTPVLESLVSAICSHRVLRKKDIYSLWDLVKDIGENESGILNVQLLNELIGSLSVLGKGKAALEAFDKFEVFQCVPNEDTYYSTIEALCRRGIFDRAWSVCEKMLDAESLPGGEKVGKILSWFCKGKKVKEAHAVYLAAIEKRKQLPMSCVNFLVAKLCEENETVQLALEMLNDIPEGRKRAIKPFSDVVRALCRIKDVDAAKKLILKMIADGPPPGNAVFNFIITGYTKVGEMGQAMEMVKLLESRGLKPDVYTYTVLMSGYSNGGEMEEARKILEEAKKKHSKLSPVMYHTLIRGYCKLEQFDEALKLLAEMKDFGVHPNVDEYEKLIQSLCLKVMDWEMAEKLQEEMKENGLHLKGISRALIRAVKEMEKEAAEAGSISSPA